MIRIKCKWLLPVGHALLDCVVLAWCVHSHVRPQEIATTHQVALPLALFLQETPAIAFDLRTFPPPADYMFLQSGNAVAGLIASFLNTTPWIVHGTPGWEPIPFTTYEMLAFASWLLVGVWVDSGRPRLRAVLVAYLVARCLIAAFGVYEVGWRIQMAFWMCLAIWLTLRTIVGLLLAIVRTTRLWSAWRS